MALAWQKARPKANPGAAPRGPPRSSSAINPVTPPIAIRDVLAGRSRPPGAKSRPSSKSGVEPLHRRAEAALRSRAGGADVDQREAGQVGLLGQRREQGLQPRPGALGPALLGFVGVEYPPHEAVDRVVVGGEEAALLVLEQLVEGRAGDAGLAGQVADVVAA